MDTVDKETRSRIMAKVQSKNTRLEEQFIATLKAVKIEGFVRYADDLPGKPDLAFRSAKVAVFIDSCFWHGCPKHLRRPSSNTSYWQSKIDRNIQRDRRIRSALRRTGWKVIRVWEHDIKKPANAVKRISRAMQ
ncbi:MAG: very short patch repair endonuclease [Deltaproteobacteria bacterium]